MIQSEPLILRSTIPRIPKRSQIIQRRISVRGWLRPMPEKPAYYEYFSRTTMEDRAVEEFKKLSRWEEYQHPPMTWITTITFFKGFLNYHVLPLFIRYNWYRFWKFMRIFFFYPLQKQWAKWDARFDAILSRLGGNGYRYSRTMVSMRLHRKIGPGRELRYRYGLLRGKDVDHCIEFLRSNTLQTETESPKEELMKDDDTTKG